MSCLLLQCKRHQLLSPVLRNLGNVGTHLGFHDSSPFVVFRYFSSPSHDNGESVCERMLPQNSLMASHLVKSCGLTSELAEFVCKRVNIVSPEKADALVNHLNERGFTPTQVSKIIKAFPKLLQRNTQKTISPKIDFFCSLGLTGPNLTKFISLNPQILNRSLHGQIIPSYNFFKSVLSRDDLVLKAYRSSYCVFLVNVQRFLARFSALKAIGVPEFALTGLLLYFSNLFSFKDETFNENVKKAIDMGFNPAKRSFMQALVLFHELKEASWQRKVKAYGQWGWSEDDVLRAFKKRPCCMSVSEEKLTGVMDFFVNTMGLKSSFIIDRPNLLLFSLDKRIIPRGRVIKALLLKGIVKKNINFHCVLVVSDKVFLDKFVVEHQGQVPQLLDIFHGKVSLEEIGFQPEDILGAQLQN